jgi:hypothetical protein
MIVQVAEHAHQFAQLKQSTKLTANSQLTQTHVLTVELALASVRLKQSNRASNNCQNKDLKS